MDFPRSSGATRPNVRRHDLPDPDGAGAFQEAITAPKRRRVGDAETPFQDPGSPVGTRAVASNRGAAAPGWRPASPHEMLPPQVSSPRPYVPFGGGSATSGSTGGGERTGTSTGTDGPDLWKARGDLSEEDFDEFLEVRKDAKARILDESKRLTEFGRKIGKNDDGTSRKGVHSNSYIKAAIGIELIEGKEKRKIKKCLQVSDDSIRGIENKLRDEGVQLDGHPLKTEDTGRYDTVDPIPTPSGQKVSKKEIEEIVTLAEEAYGRVNDGTGQLTAFGRKLFPKLMIEETKYVEALITYKRIKEKKSIENIAKEIEGVSVTRVKRVIDFLLKKGYLKETGKAVRPTEEAPSAPPPPKTFFRQILPRQTYLSFDPGLRGDDRTSPREMVEDAVPASLGSAGARGLDDASMPDIGTGNAAFGHADEMEWAASGASDPAQAVLSPAQLEYLDEIMATPGLADTVAPVIQLPDTGPSGTSRPAPVMDPTAARDRGVHPRPMKGVEAAPTAGMERHEPAAPLSAAVLGEFMGDFGRFKRFFNENTQIKTNIFVSKDQGQARVYMRSLRDGSTLPGYWVGAEQMEAPLRRVLFPERA